MSDRDQLLTRTEVESRVGLTKTTIYRLMRAGRFPEPLKISTRAVRWSASEIEGLARRPPAGERRSARRLKMPDKAFNGWHPDPETFLAALRPWGLKQTGKDEYRARCPAHDGGDPKSRHTPRR